MNGPASSDHFAAVARSLREQPDEPGTLQLALTAVIDSIPGCDHAAICLVKGRMVHTEAATSDVARGIDRLQYELNEGPCLDAIRFEQTISCSDLGQESRWPRWGPQVVKRLGVRSMVCFQLFTTSQSLGTLNLSADTAAAFSEHDQVVGLALSAHIAVALAATRDISSRDLAIVNRTVIGQAQGIVMERYGLSADTAFAFLRRISQDNNHKLVDVATAIVNAPRVPLDEPEEQT